MDNTQSSLFEAVGSGYYDGSKDSLIMKTKAEREADAVRKGSSPHEFTQITQIDAYQVLTRETAIYPSAMSTEHHYNEKGEERLGIAIPLEVLAYVGLGLGEVGEIQGKLKKLVRDGDLFDGMVVISDEKRKEIAKEIGDAQWYLARLTDELMLKSSEILAGNVNKLLSRKKRGVIGGSGDNR